MQASTIERLARARSAEDGWFLACDLAAAAGDMAYHEHTPQAIQTALNEVSEVIAALHDRVRHLAVQDTAAIYSTHAMHRVRGGGEFTICHICGDGLGD
jgi:hypothetical protein